MITTPVKLWRRGKKISSLIGKIGVIEHFTIVRVPPKNFSDQAPYPVVIVKLNDGTRTVSQLVDWEEVHLRPNQKVVAVMRKIINDSDTSSVIHYGIKFKPI